MIIQKCDICLKEVNYLNTIVLYKQPIEYCNECRKKVEEAVQEFKKEIDYENTMLDNSLKKKENKYINNLQKSLDKKTKL